jgi:putative Mg2+ transporter-C (MgtC) family protein
MLSHWELVLRLLIAAGLGSLIGAERERLIWAAGLRTHMLVCVGSCLFMVVSAYGFTTLIGPGVVLDPSRVAAQVVSGIGFLGAGSILLRGDLVRGLTTAASLWTVAAIGLAVGGGLYTEAAAATIIILVILAGIKPLEKWYQARSQTLELRLKVDRGKMSIEGVIDALGIAGGRISRFVCASAPGRKFDEVTLTIKRLSADDIDRFVRKLSALPHVRHADKVWPNSRSKIDL